MGSDINKQAKEIIQNLPIKEEAKKQLFAKLSEAGVNEDLIIEIKVALTEAQSNLQMQYKPIVDKLQQLAEEEDKALTAVHKKFEEDMNQLEETANVFYNTVNDQIDKQKISNLRQSLSQKQS